MTCRSDSFQLSATTMSALFSSIGCKVKRKKKAPKMPVNRIVPTIRYPPNVSTEIAHPNGVMNRNISQNIAMILAVAKID